MRYEQENDTEYGYEDDNQQPQTLVANYVSPRTSSQSYEYMPPRTSQQHQMQQRSVSPERTAHPQNPDYQIQDNFPRVNPGRSKQLTFNTLVADALPQDYTKPQSPGFHHHVDNQSGVVQDVPTSNGRQIMPSPRSYNRNPVKLVPRLSPQNYSQAANPIQPRASFPNPDRNVFRRENQPWQQVMSPNGTQGIQYESKKPNTVSFNDTNQWNRNLVRNTAPNSYNPYGRDENGNRAIMPDRRMDQNSPASWNKQNNAKMQHFNNVERKELMRRIMAAKNNVENKPMYDSHTRYNPDGNYQMEINPPKW